MLSRAFCARVAILPVAAVMAAVVGTSPAFAHQTSHPSVGPDGIASIVDGLARGLAQSLHDAATQRRVVADVAAGRADLLTVEPGTAYARQARLANAEVLAEQGLPASSGSVLQVRLADPSMGSALRLGQAPWWRPRQLTIRSRPSTRTRSVARLSS